MRDGGVSGPMKDHVVYFATNGAYLSLSGPFEYPYTVFHVTSATPLTRGKAHRLADYLDGAALPLSTFTPQETPWPSI